MIPKANKSVKYLILSVLEIEVFEKLIKESTLLEGGLDKPLKGA